MNPAELQRRRAAERDRVTYRREVRGTVLLVIILILALSVDGAPL